MSYNLNIPNYMKHNLKQDVVECTSPYCNEHITLEYLYDSTNTCGKCRKIWVAPGLIIPINAYTSCNICNNQFIVNKTYNQTNPRCKKCDITERKKNIKKTFEEKKLLCACCKSYQKTVTLGPNPHNRDLFDDETLVWMCERCRHRSYINLL